MHVGPLILYNLCHPVCIERPCLCLSATNCPSDWVLQDGVCYSIVSFASQGARITWEEAEAACVAEGGHLASIHSVEQQTYLYSEFLSSTLNNRGLENQLRFLTGQHELWHLWLCLVSADQRRDSPTAHLPLHL